MVGTILFVTIFGMNLRSISTFRLVRTDIVLLGSSSFLFGLLLARLRWNVPFWPILLLAAALFVPTKRRALRAVVALLLGLSLGVWRGGAFLNALQPYQDFAAQKVTIRATATIDAIYGKNSQLSFEVSHIQFIYPREVTVPGAMKISGFG